MRSSILAAVLVVFSLGAYVVAQQPSQATDDTYEPFPCILLTGEAQLSGGGAVISFPKDWKPGLQTKNLSVILTCQGGWSPLYVSPISNGQFKVGTDAKGDQDQKFSWIIVGSIKVR